MRGLCAAICALVVGCAASGDRPDVGDDAGAADARFGQDSGATASFPGPCRLDTDLGPDDIVDRRDFRTYTDGLLTRIERDNDVDGVVDYVQLRTYDAGLLATLTEDIDNDGAVDRSRVYNNGANNKVASIDFDDNQDGVVDRTFRYLYNTGDQLVAIERDNDLDGAADLLESYYRTSAGFTYRIDRDSAVDGTIDWVESRAHVDNLLQILERDTDADGDLEFRQRYIRDGDGVVLRVEIDRQADGVFEEHLLYTYDCSNE